MEPSSPLRVRTSSGIDPNATPHKWLAGEVVLGERLKYQCQVCGVETLDPKRRLDSVYKCEPKDAFERWSERSARAELPPCFSLRVMAYALLWLAALAVAVAWVQR